MGVLSRKLRNVEGGGLAYWCQGCKHRHQVFVGEGGGPRWGWNGDVERPTFTPSVLVTGSGLTAKGLADADAWFAAGCPRPDDGQAPHFETAPTVCHTFITNGRVQFLGDCTHEFAGQTLGLPDLPEAL